MEEYFSLVMKMIEVIVETDAEQKFTVGGVSFAGKTSDGYKVAITVGSITITKTKEKEDN